MLAAMLRSALRVPRSPWLWLGLVSAWVSLEYAFAEHPKVHTASPYAHGDGIYYYAYLRSLLFDRDLDFENDYELLGNQFNFRRNAITSKRENVFTIGPAFGWLPLTLPAEVTVKIGRGLGWLDEPDDGSGKLFQRIVFFGSVLAGLGALALTLRAALEFCTPLAALLGALGVGLASPLLWFMLRQPCYSHAIDALAVAGFVTLWLRDFGTRSLLRYVALGGVLGLAMLVRPQNAAHAVLPLGEWAALAFAAARARDLRELGRALGRGAAFVLALALAASPLFLAWRAIYGKWLLVPQGRSFMLWSDSRWDATLFSSKAGLFAWHPLLLVGALGLVLMLLSRRLPARIRWLGGLGLLALALQAFINGAAEDWWGGWAFGGRRFLSCTLYLGVGLAALIDLALRVLTRHAQIVARAVPVVLVLGFVLLNRSLMDDYLFGRAKHGASQPMKPLYQAALNKGVDAAYAVIGNPGALPASAVFALRAGVSPERYDAASATDLRAGAHRGGLSFADAEHAMAGFGEVTTFRKRRSRISEGPSATWVFALRQASEVAGTLTLANAGEPARVKMRVGDTWFFDQTPGEDWKDYPFVIPRAASGTGLVYVHVTQALLAPKAGAPEPRIAWEKAAFGLR